LYHIRSEYGTFVPYSTEYGTFVPYSFLYQIRSDKAICKLSQAANRASSWYWYRLYFTHIYYIIWFIFIQWIKVVIIGWLADLRNIKDDVLPVCDQTYHTNKWQVLKEVQFCRTVHCKCQHYNALRHT